MKDYLSLLLKSYKFITILKDQELIRNLTEWGLLIEGIIMLSEITPDYRGVELAVIFSSDMRENFYLHTGHVSLWEVSYQCFKHY